jgi:hypothetical protein
VGEELRVKVPFRLGTAVALTAVAMGSAVVAASVPLAGSALMRGERIVAS